MYSGILFCFIFALKHRLWVLIRTASSRRFDEAVLDEVVQTCTNNPWFEQKIRNIYIFFQLKYCPFYSRKKSQLRHDITIMPIIMLTCPCNVHTLTPHIYIVKLGFTGVYIIFLFLLQNMDCGNSLEPPH